MLTDEMVVDLQERLSLARLNGEEKIMIDIKVLQDLIDDRASIIENIIFQQRMSD